MQNYNELNADGRILRKVFREYFKAMSIIIVSLLTAGFTFFGGLGIALSLYYAGYIGDKLAAGISIIWIFVFLPLFAIVASQFDNDEARLLPPS